MTLEDVKRANPAFFSEQFSSAFRDAEFDLLPIDEGVVLRVTSSIGTRPMYLVNPQSHELSYLRHDDDVAIADGG